MPATRPPNPPCVGLSDETTATAFVAPLTPHSPSASATNFRVPQPNVYLKPGREPKHISYGEAALRDEVAWLDPLANNRRSTLYVAALRCGSLVGGGELGEERALRCLTDAAVSMLMLPLSEAMKTVRKGLKKGIRSPRSAPA